VLIPLALYWGQTPVERVLLIGSWGAVLVVELLNTGIEKAIDRISKDLHPLSGAAKDLGSAAVFMSLWLAAATWALVLL
jgi:diacylglycerol kinase (ATP)